jgi:hypothetical protein
VSRLAQAAGILIRRAANPCGETLSAAYDEAGADVTEDEPENQSADGPELSTTVATIEERPKEKRYGEEGRPKSSYAEIWTAVVNAILAAVGVYALSIYGGQLDAMEKTLGANQRSADAARASSDTAVEQLRLATADLELARRAWVLPTETTHEELQPAVKQVVKFKWTNSGGGPARYLRFETGIDLLAPQETPRGEYEMRDEGRAFVGPGGSFEQEIRMRPFSPSEFSLILTKMRRLCIYGIARYIDVFDRSRSTKFCFLYDPDTFGFHPCDVDNEAD